jgi:UPF0716 protein FxsA
MGKVILLSILLLPAAEIGLFIVVAAKIGLSVTLGLLLISAAAGLLLLRYAGRGRLKGLRAAVSQSGVAGLEAGGEAFLTAAAGILLLLPGFITDFAGLLLLLPPVRRRIHGRFAGFVRARSGATDIVDLERDQWQQVPEPALEDPRRRNDPP